MNAVFIVLILVVSGCDTGMSIVEHIEQLVTQRNAAVQEAGRLKAAIDTLTCAVCKMDMQRALKGAE